MKKPLSRFWLLDNPLDFKITMLSGPDVVLVQQHRPFKRLITLILDQECKGVIVRYLKLSSPFLGLVYYSLLVLCCKLMKKKILFFMHNFHEHTARNIWINDIVRDLMLKSASKVFVFDEQMQQVLPEYCLTKLEVLGFGPILSHLKSKDDRLTSDQKNQLLTWLNRGDVDIISVTTARRSDLQSWLEIMPRRLRVLVIDPNGNCRSTGPNVFVLHGHLYSSWSKISTSLTNSLGLLTHNNFSVPTSLYLFAELGLPVLASDVSPIREIVEREMIGVACKPCSIELALNKLNDDRQFFSANCREFSVRNSWNRSGSRLRRWL